MRTVKLAYQQFCENIALIYDQTEAKSIARIVFEDVFNQFSFSSSYAFSDEDFKQLKDIEKRLLQHEPIQYILKQADFYGLKFKVNANVLIPRQETEELVALVIESLGKAFNGRILDVGTGSGCISIALKQHLPMSKVAGLDVSVLALAVAVENAKALKQPIFWLQQDILNEEGWPKLGRFDVIVSNPPYISHREMDKVPQWVKKYEPALALFVENQDALIFYRTVSDFALHNLKSGGKLFFELNEFNAAEVQRMIIDKGFQQVKIYEDLNGKKRMLSAACSF